jgi:hypothetical protein
VASFTATINEIEPVDKLGDGEGEGDPEITETSTDGILVLS